MGAKEQKSAWLRAIQNDEIVHLERSIEDKNYLSSGRITLKEAFDILKACPLRKAEGHPRHLHPEIETWVFKPTYQGQDWYIKGYLIGETLFVSELYLISFHPSES